MFRNELKNMGVYVPGKPIEDVKREYGIEEIEKLASNENPLGPSPKAIEAIKEVLDEINIYPDAAAQKLRIRIAQEVGLSMSNIVVGNGGEQILSALAQTFINAGDEAVMAKTTFGVYGSNVEFLGGKAVKLPLKNYKHDFEGFVDAVTEKTKLVCVCNPNNPTGNIMTKDEMDYLVDNLPEHVILFIDEAYYDYAKVNEEYPESLDILRKRENTVILRTFSKVAGIAAVRVGYAMTSEKIATEMNKVLGTFNVNKLAQAAALGAMEDPDHIAKTVELNYKSLGMMTEVFDRMKLEYIPSNSNFVFVNVNKDSSVVFEELMKRGIIIRPGGLWNWNNWIRVSSGTIEQTEKFLTELEEVIK